MLELTRSMHIYSSVNLDVIACKFSISVAPKYIPPYSTKPTNTFKKLRFILMAEEAGDMLNK